MANHLWGVIDVARQFGVGNSAVSNWRTRYPDTPPPTHEANGVPLWDIEGMRAWYGWYQVHIQRRRSA